MGEFIIKTVLFGLISFGCIIGGTFYYLLNTLPLNKTDREGVAAWMRIALLTATFAAMLYVLRFPVIRI